MCVVSYVYYVVYCDRDVCCRSFGDHFIVTCVEKGSVAAEDVSMFVRVCGCECVCQGLWM